MTNPLKNPTLDEFAGLIRSAADFGPDASRLMVRLARLVARGRPVPMEQVTDVIDELGIDQDQALAHVTAYAERDVNGDVIGASPGVTLRPTSHRFNTDTAQVWTWCAPDSLVLPVVLEREAMVVSAPPRSTETVRFTASPDGVSEIEPAGTVVSFPGLNPESDSKHSRQFVLDLADVTTIEQVWKAFCHHALAFTSQKEAQAWLGDRDDVVFTSLDEAFHVVRGVADGMLSYG